MNFGKLQLNDEVKRRISSAVSSGTLSHAVLLTGGTEKERKELYSKIRCCANEFVRYIHEHRPDIEHASLTDAMACFGIEWEGVAHTSIADTIGCMKVWERLFPHYYESEEK